MAGGWRRRVFGPAVLLLGALALTGCSGALFTTPAFSVQGLFLYLRRGALESAWQEIGPALQASNRPEGTIAPNGVKGTALRWTSDRAFRREAATQLGPFLRGARLATPVVDPTVARVVAHAAAPSRAVAFFTLVRVDNEWVIQRLVVTGDPAATSRAR